MIRGSGNAAIRDVERLLVEGTAAGVSDEHLLARFAAARDRSSLAFEAIVRRHGPMVLETCRRLLRGDHHAAEDAFQATFLVLARRAGAIRVRPSGSLAPWLHEVACRTARKARVAGIRRRRRETLAILRPAATGGESALIAEELDDNRVLHEEVSRLPEKYRAAIVLCYFEGLTQDQAAKTLSWPVGTVRGYLARARDLLRTRLVRRGVGGMAAVGLMEARAEAALSPSLIDSIVAALVDETARPAAVALGAQVARGLSCSRLGRPMAALALLALGAGGAGFVASWHGSWSADGAMPAAATSGRRQRLDLHGDPLPEGAVARLGTSRLNHGNGIQAIAYTPDGHLVSFGRDGRVHLWHAATGQLLRTVVIGAAEGAYHFALSPDGKRLVVADNSAAGTMTVWDVATGGELRRVPMPAQRQYFSLLRYAPDGRTLALSLIDESIVFLDAETLKELRRIRIGSRYVHHAEFSRDGRLFAATVEKELAHVGVKMVVGGQTVIDTSRNSPAPDPAEDATIGVWDVATAAEVRRIEIRGRHPECLVFSPGGALISSFCDRTIRSYDPVSGRETSRIDVGGSTKGRLAVSHDGTTMALGVSSEGNLAGDLAEIRLFDLLNRKELHRFPANDQVVSDLAFSLNDRVLATVGGEKVIRRWSVVLGSEINPLASHLSSVACLAVSPADQSVITGGYDDAIRRWDPATGRQLAVIGRHPAPVYDLAIAPDGRSLLSADIGANVRLWDLDAKGPTYRSLTTNPVSRGRSLAISPDGRLAAASGKIAEVSSAREVASLLDEKGRPFLPWAWAAFTPDNSGLVATDGSAIWLWDVAGGKPVRKVAAPQAQIMSVAVSPDGRLLAAGVDASIRLWHLATGREVKADMRHDAGYSVAAFSPDGRLIVSGCGYDMTSDDPSVRVWEVASGREVRRFHGHQAGIYSVAFFPDGRRVASAGSDAIAMVWDLSLEADVALATPGLDLDRLWADLGGDASRAYRAIWRMTADAGPAVAFLGERLRPIRQDDADRDTSLGPLAAGETLRRLRAITVLEKVHSPAARRVLETIASGLDGARETRDARAALRRVN
jgi:RNA polymerase sigma factor (sigma-70 family)